VAAAIDAQNGSREWDEGNGPDNPAFDSVTALCIVPDCHWFVALESRRFSMIRLNHQWSGAKATPCQNTRLD